MILLEYFAKKELFERLDEVETKIEKRPIDFRIFCI